MRLSLLILFACFAILAARGPVRPQPPPLPSAQSPDPATAAPAAPSHEVSASASTDPGEISFSPLELPPVTTQSEHAQTTLASPALDPSDPLSYLALRSFDDRPAAKRLKRSQASRDLDILQAALDGRYSYAKLRGIDYHGAIERVRSNLGDSIDRRDFAIQVSKVLSLFGDGHTRVQNQTTFYPEGCLPFLVEDAGGNTIAIMPDRSRFFADDMPYLAAIDGIDISHWRAAAKKLVACGTEALARSHAVPRIMHLSLLRRELGLPAEGPPGTPPGKVRIDVGGRPGQVDAAVFVDVLAQPPLAKPRPLGDTRRLDGDLGYLRIPQMRGDSRSVTAVTSAMHDFADTRGLVIDVRGNGGGTRDILLTLAPYFLATDEPMQIVNMAAIRRHEDNPGEDQAEDRFISPADAPGWLPEERPRVRWFLDRFEPEWKLPDGDFGQWNLLTVRPGDSDTYFYSGPVVFLVDGGCYSATDVFLSAFQGRPRMTLLGTPSGGGSGWPQSVRLPDSRVDCSMSSMASFRADGTLFEGRGVIPEVIVEPTADDLLGATDTQLDAAVALLRNSAGQGPRPRHDLPKAEPVGPGDEDDH